MGNLIKNNHRRTYITGDLIPGKADEITDLTALSFREETFDYIMCNHVLEHIPDEAKAFSEIRRCLKPNGQLIISFPICTDQDTVEDALAVTAEDRVKRYGQSDHFRLYGRDSATHLKSYGFVVEEYKVNQILTEAELQSLGLIEKDTVFICTKQQGTER